jgi:MoxR-like ATPase
VLLTLFVGGNSIITGVPGLAKTLLVQTLAGVLDLDYSRIQFTPDLMPADITGTIALLHDERGNAVTRFQPGPVFAQMVLTDEINRATPKTQSALLEAMQEHTVTVAGQEYELPSPFFVLATQNPIEMDGTYLLPEAQIDRFFFKVSIPYPDEEMLDSILDLTTGAETVEPKSILTPDRLLQLQKLTREVPVASHVRRGVVRFVLATQPDRPTTIPAVQRYVRFGASPRGAQTLILAAKARALLDGRFNVSFTDVRAVILPALRHRFRLNFEGEAEGVEIEKLLIQLWEQSVDARSE